MTEREIVAVLVFAFKADGLRGLNAAADGALATYGSWLTKAELVRSALISAGALTVAP